MKGYTRMYVYIIGRHTQVEESSHGVVSRMKAVETTNGKVDYKFLNRGNCQDHISRLAAGFAMSEVDIWVANRLRIMLSGSNAVSRWTVTGGRWSLPSRSLIA